MTLAHFIETNLHQNETVAKNIYQTCFPYSISDAQGWCSMDVTEDVYHYK